MRTEHSWMCDEEFLAALRHRWATPDSWQAEALNRLEHLIDDVFALEREHDDITQQIADVAARVTEVDTPPHDPRR